MKTQPYYWITTNACHTVVLKEEELLKDESRLMLTVDQVHQANLEFTSWYLPGLAFGAENFLIWCGTRIYAFNYETGKLSASDLSDEVITAYANADLWCLVCETSIALFDSSLDKELSRFQHSEVILRSWWVHGALIVEDFENRRLEVSLGPSGLEVKPIQAR
jgi:hypothetical protein